MIRQEIKCADGNSVFRIERDGKVRLILRPEEKSILVGWLSENVGAKVLMLYKTKSEFHPLSYTLGVPKELLGVEGVMTVAINARDTNKYYCATRGAVQMFGYEDEQKHRQNYIFLDFEHWTAVGELEDVMEFYADNKASRAANV